MVQKILKPGANLFVIAMIPSVSYAASSTELWKGLLVGMTAAEASLVLTKIPGVKRTKIGKKAGLETIEVVTDYYEFTVAEQRAKPLLKFSEEGLVSVSLYIMPRLGSSLCASEILAARELFSGLMAQKYWPVEGIPLKYSGDGVEISLEGKIDTISSAFLRGNSASSLPDFSAARCASDGGRYGSFVVRYVDGRMAKLKDDAGEQRLNRALNDL